MMTYTQGIRYAGKMSGHSQGIIALALHWATILERDGYLEEAGRIKDLSSVAEDVFMSVCSKLEATTSELVGSVGE